MISVRVQLKGFLAWLVQNPDIAMTVRPGTTLSDLIVRLAVSSDDRLRNTILNAAGHPDRSLGYALDRQAIAYPRLAHTTIERDCRVTLFPLAAGG